MNSFETNISHNVILISEPQNSNCNCGSWWAQTPHIDRHQAIDDEASEQRRMKLSTEHNRPSSTGNDNDLYPRIKGPGADDNSSTGERKQLT